MRLSLGVLTVLALSLAGCATSELRTIPAVQVFTTGYTDIRPGHQPQARTTFSRGEIVTAIVMSIDRNPRSVLVEILRSADNQLVYKSLVTVQSGMLSVCNLEEPLPAGNYSVRLSEGGRLLDAANFGVY